MGKLVNNLTDPTYRSIFSDFSTRSVGSGFDFNGLSVTFTNNANDLPALVASIQRGEVTLSGINGFFSQYGGGQIYLNPDRPNEVKMAAFFHELTHYNLNNNGTNYGPKDSLHYPNFYYEEIVLMQALGYPIPFDVQKKYIDALKEFPDIAKKYHLSDDILFNQCFPATTPILTPTGFTPIAHIRVGDAVLAFDGSADGGRRALVPARVTKLFRNVTREWIELSWQEPRVEQGNAQNAVAADANKLSATQTPNLSATNSARAATLTATLTATPGHHFLDEFGNFPTLAEMMLRGKPVGNTGEKSFNIVLADGTLQEVTARRVMWSADTAGLYGNENVAGFAGSVGGYLKLAA